MSDEGKKQEQAPVVAKPAVKLVEHPKHEIAEIEKLKRLLAEGKPVPDYLVKNFGEKLVKQQQANLTKLVEAEKKSIADKVAALKKGAEANG